MRQLRGALAQQYRRVSSLSNFLILIALLPALFWEVSFLLMCSSAVDLTTKFVVMTLAHSIVDQGLLLSFAKTTNPTVIHCRIHFWWHYMFDVLIGIKYYASFYRYAISCATLFSVIFLVTSLHDSKLSFGLIAK